MYPVSILNTSKQNGVENVKNWELRDMLNTAHADNFIYDYAVDYLKRFKNGELSFKTWCFFGMSENGEYLGEYVAGTADCFVSVSVKYLTVWSFAYDLDQVPSIKLKKEIEKVSSLEKLKSLKNNAINRVDILAELHLKHARKLELTK